MRRRIDLNLLPRNGDTSQPQRNARTDPYQGEFEAFYTRATNELCVLALGTVKCQMAHENGDTDALAAAGNALVGRIDLTRRDAWCSMIYRHAKIQGQRAAMKAAGLKLVYESQFEAPGGCWKAYFLIPGMWQSKARRHAYDGQAQCLPSSSTQRHATVPIRCHPYAL